MTRSEKILVVLLRASAVVLLAAVVPAVMPFAWMREIHRHLGMGELPAEPIVGYLTRSLSAMYALHGVIVWVIASDVRRFRPIVQYVAALGVVFGAGMFVLDLAVGMPLRWTACEGPFICILGSVLLGLACRIRNA